MPHLPFLLHFRPPFRRGHTFAWVATAVATMFLGGCGNAIYAVQASSASSRLEEARELRAEELAPYEYTMALEHLKKARSEAAEADYGDAIVFAEMCEDFSEKAIRISQEAHRSAGR